MIPSLLAETEKEGSIMNRKPRKEKGPKELNEPMGTTPKMYPVTT